MDVTIAVACDTALIVEQLVYHKPGTIIIGKIMDVFETPKAWEIWSERGWKIEVQQAGYREAEAGSIPCSFHIEPILESA